MWTTTDLNGIFDNMNKLTSLVFKDCWIRGCEENGREFYGTGGFIRIGGWKLSGSEDDSDSSSSKKAIQVDLTGDDSNDSD